MHLAKTVLDSLKQDFHDTRLQLLDLELAALEQNRLVLSGRVLDADTLAAVRRAFCQALPDLEVDVQAARVLRGPQPEVLRVCTNLTGLHAGPSFLSEQLSQLLWGWPLEILDGHERWVFVRQEDGYLGWAYRPYLDRLQSFEATHIVSAPVAVLLANPDPHSLILTRVLGGTGVQPLTAAAGFVEVHTNQRGWMAAQDLRALAGMPPDGPACRAQMVADAARLVGTPYQWGGCTANGIDCSGLAQLLYRWVGFRIPRDADMQYKAGRPVEPPFQPGDLLFFGEQDQPGAITHVAVSLGGWQIMHSSRARNGVYVDDVNAVEHLRQSYFAACSYLE